MEPRLPFPAPGRRPTVAPPRRGRTDTSRAALGLFLLVWGAAPSLWVSSPTRGQGVSRQGPAGRPQLRGSVPRQQSLWARTIFQGQATRIGRCFAPALEAVGGARTWCPESRRQGSGRRLRARGAPPAQRPSLGQESAMELRIQDAGGRLPGS